MHGLQGPLSAASAGPTAARLLYDLLRVYTPPGREEEAEPVLDDWARRLGLSLWRDASGNIVVSPPGWEESFPVVALASHVDTVPGWWEPRVEGGWVSGRGAVDAKGPLVAMVVGLALAAREGLPCHAGAMALLGEEGESPGAWGLLARGDVPPYVVVGEPTGGDGVAIGYRGSLKLRVECRASGGHSASAEGAAGLLVDGLCRARREIPGLEVTVLRAGEAWNVSPRDAWSMLDYRYTGTAGDGLEAAVRACSALPDGCSCSEIHLIAPVRVSLQGEVPRALVRALRTVGVRPRVSVKQGTSDMNILAWRARSIAAYGPGDPRLAHTSEERISVEDLGRAARVYAETVKSLCISAVTSLGST